VYTFIGIKNKWLYVFLSSAYLTSLAVTVLIIYLMTPPVTDAVQGAFFVAALATGCIFGGISLVFPDITDGLGCMLGGFCLSMWFLTLKEGGLIESVTGRRIFIAALTAVCFCFSFSHHTRTYALMASIAFAGATAAVLGIDCLSRAGWKEFWIYLWDLNDKEFPLDTNTYPVTRGIKVEIAGVIILFVCGIISQVKLWKLIQEHRENKTAVRLQEVQRLEQEDEEVGRRVEHNLMRERAQWEATYGDRAGPSVDSVIESSKNSHLRKSDDTIEMKDMRKGVAGESSQNLISPTVTVTAVQDDGIYPVEDGRNPRNSNTQRSPFLDQVTASGNNSSRVSAEIVTFASTRSSLRSSLPPPPVLVPLPFTIPVEQTESQKDDSSSISAAPESILEPVVNRMSSSKRLSGASAKYRLSTGRSINANSESVEALVVPHIEDDRSSVAATLDKDDVEGLYELSPSNSHQKSSSGGAPLVDGPYGEQGSANKAEPILIQNAGNESNTKPTLDDGKRTIEDSSIPGGAQAESPSQQSLMAGTDPKPQTAQSKRISLNTGGDDGTTADSPKPIQTSGVSQAGSRRTNLKDLVPQPLSKVVLSYRTNEWAKHLEQAEKPELDELAEPESPGVRVDQSFPEAPAPVNKEILQPVEPELPPMSKRDSAGTNPYRNSHIIRSTSNLSKHSQVELPQTSLSRSSSFAPLASPAAPASLSATGKPRGLRTSSTPYLGEPIAESPIEEDFAERQFTPSPVPGSTLLDKRETLIQKRAVSQSFTPYTSTSSLDVRGLDGSTSRAKQRETGDVTLADKMRLMDQENMTLAQRKQLIQGSRPPSSSQKMRQNSRPAAVQVQGFDSHQPKRPTSMDQEKREVLLANWRESIRQDLPTQNAAASEESRRLAMINNIRQKEMEKQQQAVASTYRDAMVDNMMRSGEMLEAHREAMRRLQANANKNA
jgi:hypothetical protein